MGVPKFYRWISERYPCLSETVKEYQIPEFDNLYLDMNGIIHTCSHPNDDDIHFRISEEKIMADIFHYLEVLFRLIRPQKVFFMAIDGVAPRAKMNQQRGRRFRSAKEAEDKEKEALRKGEVLPTEERFDSNCITPGTEFMVRLQAQLEYFVSKKVSEDPLWQKTQVVLSGHQVPGEGEHKIMEFIRFQRSKPDYDVDTRHCLYGLDADLMMLGLCSHEPYFSLLREEVKFGGKKNEKRVTTPEETTFHLLHLSLLREYLDLEFTPLKNTLKFPYDLEHIIDDWVLMGFLVGNDFIPHLPHFHINKGALPLLYSAYIDVLPTLDGYINENGVLNLPRFEKFMQRLAQIDYDHFNDIYADTKWLESRRGRKQLEEPPKANARNSDTLSFLLAKAAEVDDLLKEDGGTNEDGDGMVPDASEVEETDESEEDEAMSSEEDDEYDSTSADEDKQFQAEFKAHKRNYYMDKLEYNEVDGGVLRDQAEGYVRAIQWILHYYYSGVCSWSWFYPHHYAPYVSDIRGFSELELKYDLGKPFLPYEQLLGVLPAASRSLLPSAHRSLMTAANSPIIEFYPSNFELDKNGKQQDWEAVVLIPFIDEVRLIDAMKDCESRLTEQEQNRNNHGPMQVYVYTEKDLGPLNAPAHFPPILHNRAECRLLTRDAFVVPPEKLVKGLHPRFSSMKYVPGFPSMRHLPYTGVLKKSNVTVFHMSTLNESQILTLSPDPDVDIEAIGPSYCGQNIYVNWPHLMEARVVAVASTEVKYSFEVDSYAEGGGVIYKTSGDIRKMPLTPRDVDEWRMNEKEIKNRYAGRWGVHIGQTSILVYATPIVGRKYVYTQSGRVTLEKQWSPIPVAYALQTTVKDIQVKESIGHQFSTLAEVFPVDATIFMLGQPGYGLQGRVLAADKNLKGKVRVEFENIHEADIEEQKQRWLTGFCHYMPGYVGAQRLGISPHLISRITGTIYMTLSPTEKDDNRSGDRPRRPKKINVGLSLKFNKTNEEVPGWSKKVDSGWLYSMKTIDMLRRYIQEFPEFFDFIAKHNSNSGDDFTDVQIFGSGPKGVKRALELQEFVQTLPCAKATRQACGTTSIDTDTLSMMLKFGPPGSMKLKPQIMKVGPHLLYKPDLAIGSTPPDSSTSYQLLDRIVNVRQGYSVPVGLRGLIISIKNAHRQQDVMYEVLFDKEFSGGLPVRGMADSPTRVYNLPAWAMINLSHGKRQQVERDRQGKPTAVVRPNGSNVKQASVQAQQPPKQTHASYKAAAEQKPGQAKATQQQQQQQPAKILTRPKAAPENPKQQSASGKGVPSKAAPSPSALPAPSSSFLDIWNSLLVQHQQQTNGGTVATAANSVKASSTPTEAPKGQQQQSKSKATKEPPTSNAPKLPSLQEAARNLPKVPKPGPNARPPPVPKQQLKPDAGAGPVPVPAAPALPAVLGVAATATLPPPDAAVIVATPGPGSQPPLPAAPVPGGPSISVQQLFDLAGQQAAVVQGPLIPPQPRPPVYSYCMQLMDVMHKRGFGIPLYNYLLMPDGAIMAEISLVNLGVIGRGAGKTKIEAAELAASVALRHPVALYPPVIVPNFPHPPGVVFGPPPAVANVFAGPALVMQPQPLPQPIPQPPVPQQPPPVAPQQHRGPVPNSFVPLQVTRHSVQNQPRGPPPPASKPAAEPVPKAAAAVPEVVKTEESTLPKTVAENPTPSQAPERPAPSSKPPGSRLAIRFNGP